GALAAGPFVAAIIPARLARIRVRACSWARVALAIWPAASGGTAYCVRGLPAEYNIAEAEGDDGSSGLGEESPACRAAVHGLCHANAHCLIGCSVQLRPFHVFSFQRELDLPNALLRAPDSALLCSFPDTLPQ